MIRWLTGVTALCLMTGVVVAQDPIVAVKVTPEMAAFKDSSATKPIVLKSQDDAAKYFGKDALDTLGKAVDFKKQIVLVFAWQGSGGDKLTYAVAESFPEQIMFSVQPGLTLDLRPHTHVYALRSNVKWNVKRAAIGGKRIGENKVEERKAGPPALPVRQIKVAPADQTVIFNLGGQSKVTMIEDADAFNKLIGKDTARGLDGVDFKKESLVLVSWTTSGPPDGILKHEIKGEGDKRQITFYVQGPGGNGVRGQRARIGFDVFAVPRGAKVNFEMKERQQLFREPDAQAMGVIPMLAHPVGAFRLISRNFLRNMVSKQCNSPSIARKTLIGLRKANMKQVISLIGFVAILTIGVGMLPSDVSAEKKKEVKKVEKDTNKNPPATDADYKALSKQKELVGKLVTIDSANVSLRVEYPHYEPNPKYKQAAGGKGGDPNTQAMYNLMKSYNDLQVQMQRAALAKNPREAMQAQQRLAQDMARLQQQINKLYGAGGAKSAKVDPNNQPFILVNSTKDFELPLQEKVVFRKMMLPFEYDDTGNVRTYSEKEKADLRGDDKTKPGYMAKLAEFQASQEVRLILGAPVKKEKDTDVDAEKVKDAKDAKAAPDAVARPSVTMVVMTKDASGPMTGTPAKEKKKKN